MFAGLPSLTHEQQAKSCRADPGTDGTRDEQRPGNRAGGRKSCVPTTPASESWRVLRMKTSNTLIRIDFV
ncbi:Uncharacterised protein [Escherichia coli]|nr:Uncharacterised protein [Escherichia coli]